MSICRPIRQFLPCRPMLLFVVHYCSLICHLDFWAWSCIARPGYLSVLPGQVSICCSVRQLLLAVQCSCLPFFCAPIMFRGKLRCEDVFAFPYSEFEPRKKIFHVNVLPVPGVVNLPFLPPCLSEPLNSAHYSVPHGSHTSKGFDWVI